MWRENARYISFTLKQAQIQNFNLFFDFLATNKKIIKNEKIFYLRDIAIKKEPKLYQRVEKNECD